MSGIEVVGLVCAVVSAFTGAAALLKRRKAKKEDAKQGRQAVEKSLAIGPPTVQGEYDRDFARLGPVFAKGDDIASHQLKDIVIQMQSQMITTLHILLGGGTTNYEDLLGISEDSRIRAVSALGEQFQRIATAAPLGRGPTIALQKELSSKESLRIGSFN